MNSLTYKSLDIAFDNNKIQVSLKELKLDLEGYGRMTSMIFPLSAKAKIDLDLKFELLIKVEDFKL